MLSISTCTGLAMCFAKVNTDAQQMNIYKRKKQLVLMIHSGKHFRMALTFFMSFFKIRADAMLRFKVAWAPKMQLKGIFPLNY